MNRAYLPLYLCAIAALSCPVSAQASEHTQYVDSLLSMSLEDLSNIQVEVASKKPEKMSNAPAVISVVTAADIKRYGANNLTDILKRMPNVYSWGSYAFPQNVTSIRAGSPTHTDNHTLILINGRPMREGNIGGVNAPIYQSFPVDIIERIEMIRGPGSVLYGTNAFTGVLNIITKSAGQLETASLSAGYGSFDTTSGTAVASQVFNVQGHDVEVMGAANFNDSDGWDLDFTGTSGRGQTLEYYNQNHSIYGQMKYRGFTLMASDAYLSMPRVDVTGNTPTNETFKRRRRFIDAEYSQPFLDSWNWKTNITYNGLDEVDNDQSNARDTLIETALSGHLTDRVSVLSGVVMDNIDIQLDGTTTDSTTLWSWYAQGDWQATEWLKLTGGLQVNKPKGLDKNISPRLAAVITPFDNWGFKLLYGEAFRSSSGVERALNIPGLLVGDPSVKPETIKTFDAQIVYDDSKYHAALTAYKSIQNDTIAREGSNPMRFANTGDVVYKGVEFEAAAQLTPHWRVDGSLTWQTGEDDTGYQDIGVVPHTMAKLGVSYDRGRGYSVGVFNTYASEPAEVEQNTTGVSIVNGAQKPTNFMTANVNLDINKLTGWQVGYDTELNIFIDNLLDEDMHFPEMGRRSLNTLPQHSGRAIYARLKVKF